jgi:crotonobetainyl-CoA:carnitine CoA-transferase CaiB-like acyl-CoA transferase
MNYRCYGPTAQAFAGLTHAVGLPGRPPAGWGYSYMDHMGGWYLALAVLLALNYRARTGKGQFIELGQSQIGCTLTGPVILDYTANGRRTRDAAYPSGNRASHPQTAPHNTYRCRGDDAWCMIVCFTDAHWRSLVKAMGCPAWTDDAKFGTVLARLEHQDELDAQIEAWTVTQDKHELMTALQLEGVPAAAVATAKDRLENDPQLAARGIYVPLDHPETGVQRYEGNPTRFEKTPGQPSRPAPRLGEDNHYVYGELLKFSPEEVARLQAAGVIGEAAEPTDQRLRDEVEMERVEGVI